MDAPSEDVDARLQLRDGRARDLGSPAHATQFGVHGAVRFAALPRVEPDEAVEQLSLLAEGAKTKDAGFGVGGSKSPAPPPLTAEAGSEGAEVFWLGLLSRTITV